MNASNEIVPRRFPGESFDPGLKSLDEIAFETEADGEPGGSHLFNQFKVARQILDRHAPFIKLFRHWVMIGESDLSESGFPRGLHVFNRLAYRMVAEGCMDVIVGPNGVHTTILFRRTKFGDG